MTSDPFNRLRDLQLENDGHAALMAQMRPRFERMAQRHENGTAPRAISAFQLFQTPKAIAARLVALADVQPGMRVLEPSCGLGRILDELPRPREVVAVEVAPECAAEIYAQNRAGVILKQRDFLTCTPAELGTFDRIVMNPPFHMRADIRHILHARTFLKPDGKLSALCLLTSHRIVALKPLAATWEELPESTFAKEGTHVRTALLTLNA